MPGMNGVMMQYFQWYCPPDGSLWDKLRHDAPNLAHKGFTALWLPPVYKGSSANDVGYNTYDLFDLGEFDQKGSVRTKYGTKAELFAAVNSARSAGLQIYLDTVFNHKNGGDETEVVEAVPVAPDNRNWDLGGPRPIRIWSKFTFPGRGTHYSSMKWDARHFDSVNHNADDPGDRTIYRLATKSFETGVSQRLGNDDFLMACDLDMNAPEVQAELQCWGRWIVDTLGIDGFRLDAVKHISSFFLNDWLDGVRSHVTQTQAGRSVFAVGEYWDGDVNVLSAYLNATGHRMSLFDVPLHYRFHEASRAGRNYDLRTIFDHTLVAQQPTSAVTFVDNHDTQPLQSMESVVEPWFKPLAYALILLREAGYPCVFYGDYYGATYSDRGRDGQTHNIILPNHHWLLDKFLYARHRFAWGPQQDYFASPNLIGWVRLGHREPSLAMAVVMSNGDEGRLWMNVQRPHTVFYDLTEHVKEQVETNGDGWAEFHCQPGSVSVWIQLA